MGPGTYRFMCSHVTGPWLRRVQLDARGLGSMNSGQPTDSALRRMLHKYVPAGLQDPVGLARRLIQTRDPDAMFALRAAAIGPFAWPLDLALRPFERARYNRASLPQKPVVLVCGPARSGTTLVAQLVIHGFKVSYLSNLTSVFPSSPLAAMALFGQSRRDTTTPAFRSFYGRTRTWAGPNDGLYLWDRWLGRDRSRPPIDLVRNAELEIPAFFGALELMTARPFAGKNNALNASAHLIADVLPTATFICLERDRLGLAASLYRARLEIQGTTAVPYGLMPAERPVCDDPVEDICRQVLFHEAIAQKQVEHLGPKRFWQVKYEEVCRDPRSFLEKVGRDILGESPDFSALQRHWFRSHESRLLDPKVATRFERTFERLAR